MNIANPDSRNEMKNKTTALNYYNEQFSVISGKAGRITANIQSFISLIDNLSANNVIIIGRQGSKTIKQ